MAAVIFEEQIAIPLGINSLAEFRHWTRSDSFPARGRIDFIEGDMEVDMSPEDLFTHGSPKAKLLASILLRVDELDLGHIFSDHARISHPTAQLSVEPDIVVVKHESIEQNLVRFVPKAGGAADRYVEIEGTPDLIVELVSDASVRKDTQRLLEAYRRAQVPEYWLVDARGEEVSFQLFHLTDDAYERVVPDTEGFCHSAILNGRVRLRRERGRGGFWQYWLDVDDR